MPAVAWWTNDSPAGHLKPRLSPNTCNLSMYRGISYTYTLLGLTQVYLGTHFYTLILFSKLLGPRIRPTWHTFILPIHGVEWWHLGLPLLLAWYGHNQGTLWYVGRTWKGHIGAYTKIKTLHISLGRKDWWIHFRKLICHSFGYRHSKAELTQIQVVHGSLCSYCVRVLPLTGPPPRSKQLTVTCLLLSVQMHLQVQLNSKFRGIRSHSRLCGQRSSEQSLFMTLRENSL